MIRPNEFQPGPAHPRFRDGRGINTTGYVRIQTGRRNQQPYEHRWVIENLMLEQALIALHAGPWAKALNARHLAEQVMELFHNPPRIPAGVQIHHCDYDRQHNCPCNLMLLDAKLHRALTISHRKYVRRQNELDMMSRLRGEKPGEAQNDV